jgi:hypothetical protein
MPIAPHITEWLLPPILVALVASGLAFKFWRRRRARTLPGGWREARVGLGGRVFGASAIAFALLLPAVEPLSPGEEFAYLLAVVHVVMIGAALIIRYVFFFRVRWNDREIDHRGLWRRRRLDWDHVVATSFAKGVGLCLRDRRRRRFWVPVHLDGFDEFRGYADKRA